MCRCQSPQSARHLAVEQDGLERRRRHGRGGCRRHAGGTRHAAGRCQRTDHRQRSWPKRREGPGALHEAGPARRAATFDETVRGSTSPPPVAESRRLAAVVAGPEVSEKLPGCYAIEGGMMSHHHHPMSRRGGSRLGIANASSAACGGSVIRRQHDQPQAALASQINRSPGGG